MTPIATTAYLTGSHKLPAGAVPLASDKPASSICQTPAGRWIRWWPGTRSIEALPPAIQASVIAALTAHFGGRQKFADALEVNVRTIDAWKRCVQTLPVRAAEQIARLLAQEPTPTKP